MNHYPSHICALARAGRLDVFFWIYVLINGLYLAKRWLGLLLRFGRPWLAGPRSRVDGGELDGSRPRPRGPRAAPIVVLGVRRLARQARQRRRTPRPDYQVPVVGACPVFQRSMLSAPASMLYALQPHGSKPAGGSKP